MAKQRGPRNRAAGGRSGPRRLAASTASADGRSSPIQAEGAPGHDIGGKVCDQNHHYDAHGWRIEGPNQARPIRGTPRTPAARRWPRSRGRRLRRRPLRATARPRGPNSCRHAKRRVRGSSPLRRGREPTATARCCAVHQRGYRAGFEPSPRWSSCGRKVSPKSFAAHAQPGAPRTEVTAVDAAAA